MNEKAKTDKLKGVKKLAQSPNTEKHVKALAEKIKEDPAFPLLFETAQKMHKKHLKSE